MKQKGPSPASVAGIQPRNDLKYDVTFAVQGQMVQLRMSRRLGNKFTKYNIVGSTGLLAWNGRRLVDWQPVPIERVAARPAGIKGSPRSKRKKRKAAKSAGRQIFISYPHGAADDANWVATAFEAGGAEVWIDATRLKAADSLPESIASGIASSDVFVPLVDEAWLRSEWCVSELELAKRHGTRVAPIQIGFGKMRPSRAVQAALREVGDPLMLDLRRPDASRELIDFAARLA